MTKGRNISLIISAICIAVVLFVFILSSGSSFVEGKAILRKPMVRVQHTLSENGDPTLTQPNFDYGDYPDFQQGPRRRRWAFPLDVQERCSVGERLHSSGRFCVPDLETSGGDDY